MRAPTPIPAFAGTGFAQSLSAINSYGQGSAGGGYTVRSGDTLGGIALALYGDAAGRVATPVLR